MGWQNQSNCWFSWKEIYPKNFIIRLYACKDYIPIQKVDWISGKGSWTKIHGFIDADFSLTANRSSIENTNPNVIKKIRQKVDEVINEMMMKGKAFREWQKIEESASNERSAETEEKDFARRLRQSKRRKKVRIGNVTYYEPKYEAEVALVLDGILQNFPDYLKFEILDYNTKSGIDLLGRENPSIPIDNDSTIGYAEIKTDLKSQSFNHSFRRLRAIIVYDTKGCKLGDELFDLEGRSLKL